MGDLLQLNGRMLRAPRYGMRRGTSATSWYELGLSLESSDPARAVAAYERALAGRPDLADAHNNLGRLHHEAAQATVSAAPGLGGGAGTSASPARTPAPGPVAGSLVVGAPSPHAVTSVDSVDSVASVASVVSVAAVHAVHAVQSVESATHACSADAGKVASSAARAESCYRLAICARPDVALYWFNLGVSVEDQDRASEAIAAYEQAIELDPKLADAHFNLARLLEQVGRRSNDELVLRRAVRHLVRYRDLARVG